MSAPMMWWVAAGIVVAIELSTGTILFLGRVTDPTK